MKNQDLVLCYRACLLYTSEAPYGYVLNPNEQTVTFTYVDDKTPVIKESLTFSNDRQKLEMCIRDRYKMPRKLLKVQNMLFHLMPNSAFNKMGDVYKRQG